MTTTEPWWHSTTIYQVYPRSFADADGDGIGDLPGLIDHLDHLVDLGVGTVWVSPFFVSPQEDFGYDIADYCDVSPEYGTLADAQRLIDEAHRRGLHVMFDLVLNHTSDQHPWFWRSKMSRSSPKADWYIWRDGRGRGGRRPPNNWRSALEVTSAWQWGAERQQWYLASFLPCQPDLNWRHPEVRAAMFDVVRFWLRRGVDGFRLDIFGSIMKDPAFRSNPFRPAVGGAEVVRLWERRYTQNTDDNIDLAHDLHQVCAEFDGPERILLGEVFGPPDVLRRYLGDGDGLQLVFLFDFLAYQYSAAFFRQRIADYEVNFPAPLQPTYVLENHDRSRTLDRVGGDLRRARALAVLLCTVRGVPTIYQGQELGLSNTYIPLRQARDPLARTYFRWLPEPVSRRLPERINRDEVRTPIPWDRGPNAGFSAAGAVPWLPLPPEHATHNVAAERADGDSMLALYRDLLHLRAARPALHRGTLESEPEDPVHPDVVRFERAAGDDRVLVVLQLGDDAVDVVVPDQRPVLAATTPGVRAEGGRLHLPPHSGAVIDLSG